MRQLRVPAPEDEGRHRPGDHPLWEESWHLDFATGDGSFGGYVRLGILANQGISWVWTAIVGEGRRLVTVVEHEAPIPRRGSLDLRCEALWLDLVCEAPLEHWSVGLEAFGVALDEPADALRGLRGDRIGVGLDLGWETVGGALGDGGPAGGPGGSYDLHCDVSGEVLLGDEVITFDGWGSRRHAWGVHDWWDRSTTTGVGRLDDDTRWDAQLPGVDGPTGTVTPPGGPRVVATAVGTADDLAPDRFPGRAEVHIDDLELRLDVRHLSPVPLVALDGRPSSALHHGLGPTVADDGRTGAAWLTWHPKGEAH